MANVLNDQREINEKYGRAATVKCSFESAKVCQEALSQAAQIFGSIDIYIDSLFGCSLSAIRGENALNQFDDLIQSELKPTFYFTQQIVSYLKNRKRGRMIFLLPDHIVQGSSLDTLHSLVRGGLVSFAKSLAKELHDQSTTTNVLCIGPTEEYLLQHFPGVGTIKEALEKFKILYPGAKVVNSESVAGTLLYLCSNMGSSINGQSITLS